MVMQRLGMDFTRTLEISRYGSLKDMSYDTLQVLLPLVPWCRYPLLLEVFFLFGRREYYLLTAMGR